MSASPGLPRDAYGDRATRLLLILATHDGPYPLTVRELRARSGYRSLAATHRALERLKAAGLVDWEPGKRTSLRATVSAMPVGQSVNTCSVDLGPTHRVTMAAQHEMCPASLGTTRAPANVNGGR